MSDRTLRTGLLAVLLYTRGFVQLLIHGVPNRYGFQYMY